MIPWGVENGLDNNTVAILSVFGSVASIVALIIAIIQIKSVVKFFCWIWTKVKGRIKIFFENTFSLFRAIKKWFGIVFQNFFFLNSKKIYDYVAPVEDTTVIIAKLENSIAELSKKNARLETTVANLTKAFEKLNPPVSSDDTFENWDVAQAGDRRVLTINGVEFAFRYCPQGSFAMGSPKNEVWRFDNESKLKKALIDEGFGLCEVPTTQEQWDSVGVRKAEECYFKGEKLPIENISWHESDAFVKKLNELGATPDGWHFSLPTEEQWEYACRAGTTGSTYGVPLDEAAWHRDNSGGASHNVGTKLPNKWGLYDMLGNVWEWTNSKYDGGSSFVFRGGSWNSDGARSCRPAIRDRNDPSYGGYFLGFRCVLVRQLSK